MTRTMRVAGSGSLGRGLALFRELYSLGADRDARAGPVLVIRAGTLFISAVLLAAFFTPLHSAFSQTANTLTIDVSRDGQALVTERLATSTLVSRVTVDAISSDVSNILAVDENNEVLSFSNEADSITIDTLGSANVTLTYGALIVKKVTSDMWELNYKSSEVPSTVILPSASEIIYVNDIPIDIVDNVITMPAGETSIRYKTKSVGSKDFVIEWEERIFSVHLVTASGVRSLDFEQESKSLVFSLDAGTAVLAIVPKALLGGPYSVIDPNGDEVEFKQYYENSTHSWIRVEPSQNDTFKIVGTTVVPEFSFVHVAAALTMAIAIILAAFRGKVNSGSETQSVQPR